MHLAHLDYNNTSRNQCVKALVKYIIEKRAMSLNLYEMEIWEERQEKILKPLGKSLYGIDAKNILRIKLFNFIHSDVREFSKLFFFFILKNKIVSLFKSSCCSIIVFLLHKGFFCSKDLLLCLRKKFCF